MRQFTLIVLGLVALGICACRRNPTPNVNAQPPNGMIGTSKLNPRWIYISKDIRWEAPPKEITEDVGLYYLGSGSLLVLYPSGELATIACDFRKIPPKTQLSLNGVVSFTVATGTWSRNTDGTLTTVSKFCVSPMGADQTNQPSVERRCIVDQHASDRMADLLTCAQESMVPLPDDFQNIEGIQYMLRSASKCG